MNLHRANKQPDWTNVPETDRNVFQRVAARTDGVITPGNAVSVIGGITVLKGLHDIYNGNTRRGIVEIGVGRVGDLVDGTVADKTGTKGPKGEATDASVDKALMAAALPVMVRSEILPKHAAGLLLAQNLASAVTATEAKREDITIHPSEQGKKAVAYQWGSIGLYAMAHAAKKANSPRLTRFLQGAALATLAAGTALGTSAVAGYRNELNSQR